MLKKLKQIFRKKKDADQEIPESWLDRKPNVKKNSKTGIVTVQFQKRRKLHLPGLRSGKRLLAGTLLLFNFLVAQASLTSAAVSQPLAIFFYLNFFVLLDYLWKTRKKNKPEWGL